MSIFPDMANHHLATSPSVVNMNDASRQELLAEARRRGHMQRLARSNTRLMAEYQRLLKVHDQLVAERDSLRIRLERMEGEIAALRQQLKQRR